VDHLIGHWADASGVHPGSHATLKDALLLHNELRAAFRAINPRIETSFSLWNMANPRGIRGWPGYVDHRSVTTPGILEKDVIIAQATRAFSHPYSAKVTQDILQDSYRAAVWTWRRGDTEVRLGDPGLRIRIHGVMGRYFHDLPESARQLEWHNIERNHHGIANDVNYFVAAKLMWDPKTDVDAALQKYCALVFGPPNAKPVAEAFLTVEASRDLENQVSKTMQANWDEGAKRARQALAALAAVKLPSSHHSRLPSVTSPQEMLAELRASLTVIAENAELCAKTLPAIDALIQAGKLDQAKALAKVVRKKTDPWFDTLAGGMEGLWLRETLQAKIEPGAPEKIKEWFGFRTFNLADFEQKGSDFVISGRGKGAPAIALLDIEPPAQHRIEFHLQCRLAQEGKSRNGGFAFGQAVAPTKLIRCQVFGRGHQLRLSGQNLVRPIVVEAPNLDPDKPIDCAVLVDLDQHRLTFKAGEYVASGELQESVRQLRFYGYIVENTKTQFSRIAIKQSE
jgi:hypothetical protein